MRTYNAKDYIIKVVDNFANWGNIWVDGEQVILFSAEDFGNMLHDKLGNDAEAEFYDLLDNLVWAYDSKETYEEDCENYRYAMGDAIDGLDAIGEELELELQKERLDRGKLKKIRTEIERLKKELYNA